MSREQDAPAAGGVALEDRQHGADGRDRRRRTRGRRTPGPRTARRRRQRRRTAWRVLALTVAAVAITVLGVAAATWLDGFGDDPEAPEAVAETPVVSGDDQPTVVLATFDETAPTRGASQLAVLSIDEDADEGTILLVPSSTLADVPGHGLLQVGQAFGFGQAALLDATLDNLLGVDFDQTIAVSRQDWSSLFTRLGGLTLEVPERLLAYDEDGATSVRFRPGEQYLDGPRVAEYLTFREPRETELETLPRVQRVLEATLARIAEEPALLDSVFEDGAPMLDTADPALVRGLLRRLADLHAEGATVTRSLPVSPMGSGGEGSYRIDRERADALIAGRFGASVPGADAPEARSLQILNGNGTPGIGQQIAEMLVPAGFRVVLTGNADRFDHEQTRILVYSDAPAAIEAAQQVRDRLGVGVVERSEAPQSVVDLTIIVGADFPPSSP